MDVIMIAGGRGRRMGALTSKRQKGCLKYRGVPILLRILDTLALPEINSIRIATGYRSNDVNTLLSDTSYRSRRKQVIDTIDTVGMFGELTKLAYAMRYLPENTDCLFTGVDTLFPKNVMREFISVARRRNQICLMLSHRIDIAPTHRHVRTVRGIVDAYEAPETAIALAFPYIDTTVRYYPSRIVDELRHIDVPLRSNHDEYMNRLIVRGERMRTFVYKGLWRHFAIPRDLSK